MVAGSAQQCWSDGAVAKAAICAHVEDKYKGYAMSRKRLTAVLWIVCSLVVVGCDPVRTTSQLVRLRVVNSGPGQPLAGAQVSLKYDFDTAEPASKKTFEAYSHETDVAPEEWHKYKRKAWEQQPWFRGVTNKDGEAHVEVKHTEIDRSRGAKPPARRDKVTRRPYLVKVKAGEMPEQEMTVLMRPGESVKGKSFTVTVIEIQQPRYVETKNN